MQSCHAREGAVAANPNRWQPVFIMYSCMMYGIYDVQIGPHVGSAAAAWRLHVASRSLVLDGHSHLPNQQEQPTQGAENKERETRKRKQLEFLCVWR